MSELGRLTAYLDKDHHNVRGMSSAFSMLVTSHFVQAQIAAGFYGDILEIGVFEARFLIALALSAGANERVIGIDTFDWPNEQVLDVASENCAHFAPGRSVELIRADSRTLATGDLLTGPSEVGFRFVHIDGDHSEDAFVSDLQYAASVAEPWGVICLDDMLSPSYPLLTCRLFEFLKDHPDWCVLSVIDRESLTAAPKIMICRSSYYAFYSRMLADKFDRFVWRMGCQVAGYKALVLSPSPAVTVFD